MPVARCKQRAGSSGVFIGASGAGEDCFDGKIDLPLLFSKPLRPLEAFSRALQPNRCCARRISLPIGISRAT